MDVDGGRRSRPTKEQRTIRASDPNTRNAEESDYRKYSLARSNISMSRRSFMSSSSTILPHCNLFVSRPHRSRNACGSFGVIARRLALYLVLMQVGLVGILSPVKSGGLLVSALVSSQLAHASPPLPRNPTSDLSLKA